MLTSTAVKREMEDRYTRTVPETVVPPTTPLSAQGRWQQKKRQQQSQQQRRKPFRLYHCHEKIPLSSFSLHPCRKSAKHGTNGIVSHFRPD